MDLTQLANLGEFIGGIAVLVTLIYLAVQVRQGRNDLRLASENHLADYIAERAFNYALTPDIARILETSLTSSDELNKDEARRAMWIAASYFHGIERMYVSYLEGWYRRKCGRPTSGSSRASSALLLPGDGGPRSRTWRTPIASEPSSTSDSARPKPRIPGA